MGEGETGPVLDGNPALEVYDGPEYDFDPRAAVYRLPDDTLWSSARLGPVAEDDPDLVAWRAAGGIVLPCPRDATGAPTLSAIHAVLRGYGIEADLAVYAAQARFARETAGIEFGGERIRTDRESQALIAGAHALALAEPDESIDFKSSSGWVSIDSAAMILIALAVARHVRACFRTERAIAAAIAAGTITGRAEIDAAFAA